ncbi:MAG: excinuclease ABC subunit UvrC, partial [Butyricicoccus sp.]|nr:excinuclease ABC subunit UvrC [Butyricicoccus sp.]
VHRFAITYNRALGAKKVRGSSLDKIEGVGEKRRILFLKHYGSIENIKAETVDELARIVPRATAQNIYDFYQE